MCIDNQVSSALTEIEVVDVHNHVFPDRVAMRGAESIRDYYNLPLRGDGTLQTLLDDSSAFNVTHIVLCSAALQPQKVHTANEFVAARRTLDSRIVSLGTTHAGVDDQAAVFEQIEELGLSGVKIHPEFQGFAVDDRRLDSAWNEAIRLDIPVLFHIGDPKSDLSSPRRLYQVMERFPELKVIAAHMGGYQAKVEAECLVGTHCYFDTSQWFYYLSEQELLKRIEKHGIEKIMYGCDYPLNVPSDEIRRLYNTHLNLCDKQKIFCENAKRLFKL